MKKYNHLTQDQRYEIERHLRIGTKKPDIASYLGVSVSTIYREIRRNSDSRNQDYKSTLAQRKSDERHKNKAKKVRFSSEIIEQVIKLIQADYSPEQVCGFLKKEGGPYVSHECIYQFIWEDKKQGGTLYKHLRTNGKRYRKRGASKDSRGIIKGRVDIDKRPTVVDDKERIGDLEVDTIIGKDHKGAIVTINDRATGMLKMRLVETKQAECVTKAIIEELDEWRPFVKTITADNGKEFAFHEQVANELNIDFYFAKPYHSWQRGANENLNGLVRQYFPKKTKFSTITQEEVKRVEDILNNRPRKRHNFLSPLEIFTNKVNQEKVSHL